MRYIAFLWGLLTLPILAQVDRATITGTLRDPSGAVVSNAKVTITYPATGLHREVAANGSGVFLFPGLPVGHVTLNAVHSGFRTIHTELELNVGETKTLDMELAVASVDSSVQVVAEADLV